MEAAGQVAPGSAVPLACPCAWRRGRHWTWPSWPVYPGRSPFARNSPPRLRPTRVLSRPSAFYRLRVWPARQSRRSVTLDGTSGQHDVHIYLCVCVCGAHNSTAREGTEFVRAAFVRPQHSHSTVAAAAADLKDRTVVVAAAHAHPLTHAPACNIVNVSYAFARTNATHESTPAARWRPRGHWRSIAAFGCRKWRRGEIGENPRKENPVYPVTMPRDDLYILRISRSRVRTRTHLLKYMKYIILHSFYTHARRSRYDIRDIRPDNLKQTRARAECVTSSRVHFDGDSCETEALIRLKSNRAIAGCGHLAYVRNVPALYSSYNNYYNIILCYKRWL